MFQVKRYLAAYRVESARYREQSYVVQEHYWFDVVAVKLFRHYAVPSPGVGLGLSANHQVLLFL
jgi:hypothetical protein